MSKLHTEERLIMAIGGYGLTALGLVAAGVIAIETGIVAEEWIEFVLQISLGIPLAIGMTGVGIFLLKVAIKGEKP